ncbi:hypothetical protein RND81_12G137100 [Saponaria officinalis]|uniref:J domain-containing protein n=1 Tax=Saponaria officinalis TaxID=3572 RepID=A0AAW1HA58_SAPOF
MVKLYSNNNDIKSQIVIDIYNIYQNSYNSSCIHVTHNNNYNNNNNIKSPFIDWYLILRIGEDASIGTIRKQYHKLALLLHPDKNKHPKAEFSFKLISQAYKCLSDNASRSSFNIERWRNRCSECSRSPRPTISSPHRATHIGKQEAGSPNPRKNSRSEEIQNNFRALREQLKEEARVIENCMRLNRASKDEYPVFDPSNYANLGYPHRRNQQFSCRKTDNSWGFQKENLGLNYDQRRNKCEIPIFG